MRTERGTQAKRVRSTRLPLSWRILPRSKMSVDEEPEGSPGAALQQVNWYIAILAKLPPAANLAPLEQMAQEVSGWRTKGMSMPGS